MALPNMFEAALALGSDSGITLDEPPWLAIGIPRRAEHCRLLPFSGGGISAVDDDGAFPVVVALQSGNVSVDCHGDVVMPTG